MAGRESQADIGIREGRRATYARAKLVAVAVECDGGATLRFEGESAAGGCTSTVLVELGPDDVARMMADVAASNAQLAVLSAFARKG